MIKLSSKRFLVFAVTVVAPLLIASFILGKHVSLPGSNQEYPLLSKRIFAESTNDTIINFVPLRTELRKYADSLPETTGIYFEYLPTGTSIGINDRQTFFAASLLKLPVVMKTSKLIEQDQLSEEQSVVIKPENVDKGFGELWQRGAGAAVTVEEAIRLAITKSDNTADKVLRDLVKPNPVSDVFDYLDIDKNVTTDDGAAVSPKSYSSILRALYLSAYLDRENSNNLLDLMTQSDFKDRIAAGVPDDVEVAHKVGIYQRPGSEDVQTHSDCGIVYIPNRPYLLCIMIEAKLEQATEYMQEISKITYDYVSGVNQSP